MFICINNNNSNTLNFVLDKYKNINITNDKGQVRTQEGDK